MQHYFSALLAQCHVTVGTFCKPEWTLLPFKSKCMTKLVFLRILDNSYTGIDIIL